MSKYESNGVNYVVEGNLINPRNLWGVYYDNKKIYILNGNDLNILTKIPILKNIFYFLRFSIQKQKYKN